MEVYRYLTEYTNPEDGKRYGDHIDAPSIEAAKKIADERGRGEEVLGPLYAEIKVPDGTAPVEMIGRVDGMTRAFAESGDDEPPPASAFEKGGE